MLWGAHVTDAWLDTIKWDGDGLVPAIAQETGSGITVGCEIEIQHR